MNQSLSKWDDIKTRTVDMIANATTINHDSSNYEDFINALTFETIQPSK